MVRGLAVAQKASTTCLKSQWIKALTGHQVWKPGFNPQDPERSDLSPDLLMLSRARFKHCVMFESERPHRASQKNLTPGSETLRDEWANEHALHRSLLWLASVRSRGASSLSPSCGHRARCRLYVTRREGTFKGLWLRPAYFSLSPSFFFLFILVTQPRVSHMLDVHSTTACPQCPTSESQVHLQG